MTRDRLLAAFWLSLPLLLFATVLEVDLANRQNRQRQDLAAFCSEQGDRLIAQIDADSWLRRHLWRIARWLREHPRWRREADFPDRWRAWQRALTVDVYAFDRAGRLIGAWPGAAPNQWLLRQLGRALSLRPGDERDHTARRLARPLTETFGKARNLDYFSLNRGRVIPVRYHRQTAWLWTEPTADGSILLFVRNLPRLAERLRQSLRHLPELRAGAPTLGFGWPATGRWIRCRRGPADRRPGDAAQTAARPDRLGAPRARLASVFAAGGARGVDDFDHEGVRWAIRRGTGGAVLIVGLTGSGNGLVISAWAVRCCLGLTWVALAAVGLATGLFPRSVRGVTAVVFAVCGLVPIGGILVGAIILFDGRAELLAASVHREQLERLQQLDGSFQRHLDGVRGTIRRVMNEIARGAPPTAIATLAEHLHRPGLRARLKVQAPDATVCYVSPSLLTGFDPTLDAFSRLAMRTWAPGRLTEVAGPPRRNALDALVGGEDLGLDFLPGDLHLLVSSGARNYLWWQCFARPRIPAAFASVLIRSDELVANHLDQQIALSFPVLDRRCAIGSFDLDTGRWRRHGLPDGPPWQRLALAASTVSMTRTGSLRHGGTTWWYTVQPATQLHRQVLVAALPAREFAPDLDRLWWGIVVGAIGSLVLAAGLGRLVSTRLLAPLSDLGGGLQALQERRFRHRLRIDRDDEFGELAAAFNEMMVGLAEFDLAGVVQRGLIGRDFPTAPGWRLAGEVQFASDVGGDCLDLRRLADGRLAFLVGDVSGHGVSSALLMAMVKATVNLWTATGHAGATDPAPGSGADLERLATMLDETLRHSARWRGFLALVAGTVCPDRGRLTLCTLGHPFPVWLPASGGSRHLGHPAWPIGSRREPAQPRPITVDLAPGDRLVLYSDGLVESVLPDGTCYGYDRLLRWLDGPGRGRATADLPGALRRELLGLGAITTDDLTLLIIEREAGRGDALPATAGA